MNTPLMQADLAKLPIWSGNIAKDSYDIKQWVNWVNRAAKNATWNDINTMSYVYNTLCGSALKWLRALKTFNINTRSWIVVRAELLDAYSRVQTTHTQWSTSPTSSRLTTSQSQTTGPKSQV